MKKTSLNQLSRLLALALAVLMLLSVFAGCKKKDKEDPAEPSDTVQTDPTQDQGDAEEPTAPPLTETPTEPAPVTVWGTVAANNLNVRTEPNKNSEVVQRLAINTRVELLEQKTVEDVVWGRIEDGWIQLNYVQLDGEQPPVLPESNTPSEPVGEETPEPTEKPADSVSGSGTYGTVTAESLNIRKDAGSSYDKVGTLKAGDKVEILETKNNWGRISSGWISLKYVKLDGATGTTDNKTDDKTDNKEYSTLVTDGKTTVLGHVVIEAEALNVRYGPGTKYEVADKVYKDKKLAYYQEKNGWVRIEEGWISLAYTDKGENSDSDKDTSKDELVTDKKTEVLGHVVITTGSLNVRKGPGKDYAKVDTVSSGDRLAYYQEKDNWVRTKDGWVSLNYGYIEGNKGNESGSGTVTGEDLNVRTGPGTGYKSVKKLNKGDKVEVLAQIKFESGTWGYTKDGWVFMQYVKMD